MLVGLPASLAYDRHWWAFGVAPRMMVVRPAGMLARLFGATQLSSLAGSTASSDGPPVAPRSSAALMGATARAGLVAGVLAGMVAGCSGVTSTSPTPAVAMHTAAAQTYLLRLDELPLPGFTVQSPPAAVDVAALAGGDRARLDRLRADHFQSAAAVRFFRPVGDLGNSNGPIDVLCTVVRFAAVDGAGDGFRAEAARQDAAAGATPLSTGPLGDEGHGDLTTADDSGIAVAQTVLVWRSANLVTVLEVHERLGGSPLTHALQVARPLVVRVGGATPLPQ